MMSEEIKAFQLLIDCSSRLIDGSGKKGKGIGKKIPVTASKLFSGSNFSSQQL